MFYIELQRIFSQFIIYYFKSLTLTPVWAKFIIFFDNRGTFNNYNEFSHRPFAGEKLSFLTLVEFFKKPLRIRIILY